MGALLRLVLRLLLAPFVAVFIGGLAAFGFILNRREELDEEIDGGRVELHEREQEDENERGERRWVQDASHTEYRNIINRVWSKNVLDTAARLEPR